MLQEPKDKNCGSPIPAQTGALLAEAMEAVEFGIMLVAGDGFILFANTMARELMRRGEGLQANGGWVATTSADITRRLREFISRSATEPDGKRSGAATIILERGTGRSSLFLHVMPIERRSTTTAQSAAAVIFIIAPDFYAFPSFNAFAALHGLTRCEARVFREIISGQGLIAASTQLRITEATARTHLRNIFEKTGTKRQTELLRLFFKATIPGRLGGASIAN
jgi:DNA-binding CsgD family transcriptional regulator